MGRCVIQFEPLPSTNTYSHWWRFECVTHRYCREVWLTAAVSPAVLVRELEMIARDLIPKACRASRGEGDAKA